MAGKLKILLMIFALGSFILPKQNFFAMETSVSCCSSSNMGKDCCDTNQEEKPCHDSENKNSCGDKCTSCGNCHFAATFFWVKPAEFPSTPGKIQQKKNLLIYQTPQISDIFSKIWQPPKIA